MRQNPRLSEVTTVDKARKELDVERGSVHYLMQNGRLDYVRVDGDGPYMIYKKSIKNYLNG